MPAADIHRTVEAVWRIESARLIAALARLVRDVGLAEELAQDAMVAALEQWPEQGVPDNPGAWLMAAARNRAIDLVRRERMRQRKQEELGRLREGVDDSPERQATSAVDNELWRRAAAAAADGAAVDGKQSGAEEDDLLRLLFMSCHPVLPTPARVALTLRLLGGLSTQEIARAFLAPEATIAQRIVRAKQTLREKQVPFEVPVGDQLRERLASVLEVIYLIFNEGYTATAGEDWMRPGLCDDALRLGRMLAALMPGEPEAHGLAALMEIQASRTRARVGTDGQPILLLEQNRAHWDQLLIHRGLAALDRAQALGTGGRYVLQASIAACHARARTADQTDWRRIAGLYDELAALMPTPVVYLNRAVAVAMADGPAAGLELCDELLDEPALRQYHLLPSVRGDLLQKLGRQEEARAEFERAAGMTRNHRERDLLLARAGACGQPSAK